MTVRPVFPFRQGRTASTTSTASTPSPTSGPQSSPRRPPRPDAATASRRRAGRCTCLVARRVRVRFGDAADKCRGGSSYIDETGREWALECARAHKHQYLATPTRSNARGRYQVPRATAYAPVCLRNSAKHVYLDVFISPLDPEYGLQASA